MSTICNVGVPLRIPLSTLPGRARLKAPTRAGELTSSRSTRAPTMLAIRVLLVVLLVVLAVLSMFVMIAARHLHLLPRMFLSTCTCAPREHMSASGRLAALLYSNELARRLDATGSGATCRAACESDKWFILPHLLLPVHFQATIERIAPPLVLGKADHTPVSTPLPDVSTT